MEGLKIHLMGLELPFEEEWACGDKDSEILHNITVHLSGELLSLKFAKKPRMPHLMYLENQKVEV